MRKITYLQFLSQIEANPEKEQSISMLHQLSKHYQPKKVTKEIKLLNQKFTWNWSNNNQNKDGIAKKRIVFPPTFTGSFYDFGTGQNDSKQHKL